jgi:hypothetical protein
LAPQTVAENRAHSVLRALSGSAVESISKVTPSIVRRIGLLANRIIAVRRSLKTAARARCRLASARVDFDGGSTPR